MDFDGLWNIMLDDHFLAYLSPNNYYELGGLDRKV
jgi:hypothetical protein